MTTTGMSSFLGGLARLATQTHRMTRPGLFKHASALQHVFIERATLASGYVRCCGPSNAEQKHRIGAFAGIVTFFRDIYIGNFDYVVHLVKLRDEHPCAHKM